jgi:glutamate-ammonia-ligase adenylyltransferase
LPLLYPLEIAVENTAGRCTTLHIVSQDTPAFLYALSTALALRGIAIERVSIRTDAGRIEDELDVLDGAGAKLLDEPVLAQVRLSILLTKQFTYFLSQATDPYAALSRFERLLGDVLRLPERGQWLDLLSRPKALQDLARLLGASDYLWEDMIRLQYESLLPMLEPHVEGRRFSTDPAELATRLARAVAKAPDLEARGRALNEFKDRELFLIDLDCILGGTGDPRELAVPLTALAEVTVNTAARLVYEDLTARCGTPRTAGGLPARYAILGLGKFGGAALGYASDIELLFVYSDTGRTDGARPMDNGEFFGLLVRETAHFVKAKREGIFHVDVRLRPYGSSGPWACSLESFCRYYGPGGAAHALERLSLTRLRWVGGDEALGRQVERLRDEFVYAGRGLDLAQLRDMRARQLAERVPPGAYNAKFSAGGLVDLEYDVQILQIMHGAAHPALRTPRIHEALEALSAAGILEPEESRRLTGAYYFLRRLINGLRMLRGSAVDLFLPAPGSLEYAHLARRMGYARGGELEPEQRLHLDFETQTAVVRTFVERHFGRQSLPEPAAGNVADLLLSARPTAELRERILRRYGFGDVERASVNLARLAGEGPRRTLFVELAVLACDTLRRMPDADRALNNWERLVAELPDARAHYAKLLAQPRRLEILMALLSNSQFLADTLVRYPAFFDWVTDPRHLQAARDRAAAGAELRAFAAEARTRADWLNALRRFRRRELLRIGTRDMCLGVATEAIMAEISALAESVVDAALARALAEGQGGSESGGAESPFCIMALGKLGGAELNYSSDVDLIGLCDDRLPALRGREPRDAALALYESLMGRVRHDLSAHTEEGYAYRVDLRLRPHGRAGHLVQPVSALLHYYEGEAALWEIQALLKMRPVAGNLAVGARFLEAVRPVFGRRRRQAEIAGSIESLRERAVQQVAGGAAADVKTGLGGIRDVEFLVQGLQLLHAPEHPGLLTGNTVEAIGALGQAGVLEPAAAERLRDDYLFLRRIEHYLQILEDRQIHALPEEEPQLRALARRVLGVEARAGDFLERLGECQERVRAAYRAGLLQHGE